MATQGEEAVGSMGNDTPISALSDKPIPEARIARTRKCGWRSFRTSSRR
jgi:hypothetical protein